MLAVEIPRFGTQDVLRVAEVPVPDPGPGRVSIDVTHAGVNFAEVLYRRGVVPVTLPYVPGIEVSGYVRAVGPGVTGLSPGEPVVALTIVDGGGYADVVVADARLVVPLAGDDAESPCYAATPSNTATAFLIVDRVARLTPGESVLVHAAAGGVGSQVGQVARLAGARPVVGTVGTPDKVAPARALGFDEVVLRHEVAEAAETLAPDGFDVVVDPVGGPTRAASLDRLAPGGRLIAIGNASDGDDIDVSANRLWFEGRAVMGHNTMALAHHAPDLVSRALRQAVTAVADGDVAVPVSDVLRLDQAGEAHARLESGRSVGKLVLAIHG